MEGRETSLLTGLAMGTLNTCLLILAAMPFIYLDSDRSILNSNRWFDTAHGLTAFAAFWVVTALCTLLAWRQTGNSLDGSQPEADFTIPAIKWGAFNAIFFFLALALAWTTVWLVRLLLGMPANGVIVQYTWGFAFFAGFSQ